MINTHTSQDIADKVKALIVSETGAFSPADFVAVAKSLGFRIDLEPHTHDATACYNHQQEQEGEGFWAIAPGASDISEGMVWMKKMQDYPSQHAVGETEMSLAPLAADVEALFRKYQGRLSAWDIDAVFSPLRSKAIGEARKTSSKVGVNWFVPDLIGTSLETALELYEWGNYAPVATSSGISIEHILLLDADGNPPPGYEWEPTRRVLRKINESTQ